jgi:hypothetical protein
MHKAVGIGAVIANLIDWTLRIGFVVAAGYTFYRCDHFFRK